MQTHFDDKREPGSKHRVSPGQHRELEAVPRGTEPSSRASSAHRASSLPTCWLGKCYILFCFLACSVISPSKNSSGSHLARFLTSGEKTKSYNLKFCLENQGNEMSNKFQPCLLEKTKMIRGFLEL